MTSKPNKLSSSAPTVLKSRLVASEQIFKKSKIFSLNLLTSICYGDTMVSVKRLRKDLATKEIPL